MRLSGAIKELESTLEGQVLVVAGSVTEDVLPIIYEFILHSKDHSREQINVVLCTRGGVVVAARQYILLLREFFDSIRVLVPFKASSAGTIICLGADEVVMGPLGQLGPIDGHISFQGSSMRRSASTEDVKAFQQLAQKWFGVNRQEDNLQVLALISQSISPISLGEVFRADQLLRCIALEMISFHKVDQSEENVNRIVEHLIAGMQSHDQVITRKDARSLGLNVRNASFIEETHIWDIDRGCREIIPASGHLRHRAVYGLVMGKDFSAQNQCQLINTPDGDEIESVWEFKKGKQDV